jgi:hypothetical protein
MASLAAPLRFKQRTTAGAASGTSRRSTSTASKSCAWSVNLSGRAHSKQNRCAAAMW